MRNKLLIIVGCIILVLSVRAEDVTGKWRTIDDTTGEIKSIVEITQVDGKLYGHVVKLFNKDPKYDPVCDQCKDHLKGTKIIGMQIINGLTFTNGRWTGDRGILDPDNGKYYNVKIWTDPDSPEKLHVRGYFSFLYRTQIWIREE